MLSTVALRKLFKNEHHLRKRYKCYKYCPSVTSIAQESVTALRIALGYVTTMSIALENVALGYVTTMGIALENVAVRSPLANVKYGEYCLQELY